VNSHELARLLLTLPDLPVATHAMNHTYCSGSDAEACGPLKVGRLHHYSGDHIVIGDILKRQINPPNWYVTEMFFGDAPEEW
jgi:hypothetical protein